MLCLATSLAADENWKGLWTDPDDATLPIEFKIGGEYVGQVDDGQTLGCQVIVLGKGAFQAVVYPGGLPGDGWDETNKILMAGQLEGETAAFAPADGNRQYLDKQPDRFSATRRFPPQGQKDYSAKVCCGVMTGKTDDGKSFSLQKTVRKSPTEGKQPPASARVLFDGSNKDEWKGGRLDEATKLLNTDGHDIRSERKFNSYLMHLEFMLPFRPDARGQGRGNSGFYQVDHYEVQILDSFGLEGVDNECGGVYKKGDPLVNTCFPPLTWQTFDVEFTNAVRDEDGNKTKNAFVTVRLNGVVVQDNLEITGPTGGHRNEPEGTPGEIKLQGHGNPLQFRNIWIVEKD
jgi:hypothetical protein